MSKFSQTTKLSIAVACCVFFSTLEATWSEAQNLTSPNSSVSLAMDAEGNAMAVWVDSDGTSANNIYSNYRKKNENWYLASPFPSTQGRAIMSSPKIAISADSKVLVAWEEWDYNGDKTTSLKMAMRPFDGKWSLTELSKTKGTGRFPDIAINATGFAVAGWRESDQTKGSPRIIRAATVQFGNTWSTPTDIGFGDDVQVRVDKAGNAVAVWIDEGMIKSANLPFGGNWSTPTVIANAYRMPSFAMNEKGYAIIAWAEDYAIQASTMQFGENWATPLSLKVAVNAFRISSVNAVMDSFGNAFVAWLQDIVNESTAFPVPPSATFIKSCDLPYGSKWSKSVNHTSKTEFASNLQIAVDDSDRVYMTWRKGEMLHAKLRMPGLPWSTPDTLTVEGMTTDSQLAVDSTGNATICWGNRWGGIQSATWTP